MSEPLALGVVIHIQPDPDAACSLVAELGIPTVQIFYPESLDNEAGISALKDALSAHEIEVTSVVCTFEGERYDDIETVRRTVGLVPESTRTIRLESIFRISKFASLLGVGRLQTHIGFIPDDSEDPLYQKMVGVLRTICDGIAPSGQVFSLETGQETAEGLKKFLEEVAHPNLKVNFDPANMILYGTGRPEAALDVLLPYIDGVHCKDGQWPSAPGQLGQETPLGDGDVYFANWLQKLIGLGYRGPLTIEREISGDQQIEDIRQATHLIERIVKARQPA